eukprot:CCRYP_020590-RB/>CCRYP_020590-RB protein AED:0.47 eAED:0.70 QI:0/0/0/1/0/0/3/0/135
MRGIAINSNVFDYQHSSILVRAFSAPFSYGSDQYSITSITTLELEHCFEWMATSKFLEGKAGILVNSFNKDKLYVSIKRWQISTTRHADITAIKEEANNGLEYVNNSTHNCLENASCAPWIKGLDKSKTHKKRTR